MVFGIMSAFAYVIMAVFMFPFIIARLRRQLDWWSKERKKMLEDLVKSSPEAQVSKIRRLCRAWIEFEDSEELRKEDEAAAEIEKSELCEKGKEEQVKVKEVG